MMTVEVPDTMESRRPAGLYRLVLRDQKSPLLQIVAFNRPVIAVIAHRIVLQRSDPISELVNMHNCERSEAIQLAAARKLDCFVACAPRNDGGNYSAGSSAWACPRAASSPSATPPMARIGTSRLIPTARTTCKPMATIAGSASRLCAADFASCSAFTLI